MRARGYPNLFATGETAGGIPLVDRQHPHDLFMELAARVDIDTGAESSLFVYGGPVGEPALGPSAFMHRRSDRYAPLAPITHHWFDSRSEEHTSELQSLMRNSYSVICLINKKYKLIVYTQTIII